MAPSQFEEILFAECDFLRRQCKMLLQNNEMLSKQLVELRRTHGVDQFTDSETPFLSRGFEAGHGYPARPFYENKWWV